MPETDSSRGHSALARLVATDTPTFAEKVWGRRHLLSRAADLPTTFSDLLDQEAVDELVSTRGLRTPFLRVAKNGRTLADRDFTAPGGVGAAIGDQVSDDLLLRLFDDGATMVLQGLHRIWPPLITFAQDLAAELGHPTQVNAYVTPAQNKGFSDHYDVHDVFVLQTEGEKRWVIHEPVLTNPLRDQPWGARRSAVEAAAEREPLLDTVLRPGDCLYLPRGFLHAATALGGVSTHVTVGVHSWTRHHLADYLIQAAVSDLADDPEVRQSLPFGLSGVAGADDVHLVREKLLEAISNVDHDAVSRSLRSESRRSQRAAPMPPLRQLRDAEHLTTDKSIMVRPHLAASLADHPDGGSVLTSRAGDLVLSADEAKVVAPLLDGAPRPTERVGLDLARRLLIHGVVVTA